MEDTQLNGKPPGAEPREPSPQTGPQEGLAAVRRKGEGLILALVIVLFTSALAALLFDMGLHFSSGVRRQQTLYTDHIRVKEQIQAIKGWIVQTNIDAGEIMPPRHYTNPLTTSIDRLAVLMFDEPELSFDQNVTGLGVGEQRIVVNVFDLHYFITQLTSPLVDDPEQMRLLPPPINIYKDPGNPDYDPMESLGEAITQDTGPGGDERQNNYYPWDRYGAYLVRVQLYGRRNPDKTNAPLVLTRTAEEAFFQILE